MARTADVDTDTPVNLSGGDDAPVALFDQTISLGGISTEYKPRDKGAYEARVASAEPRMGQQSNQPYLNVEFDLIGEGQSGKVWNSYSLQPQALWRLKGDLIKMGVDAATLEADLTIQDIIYEMNGRECIVNLDIETYKANDGQMKSRNKVTSVAPIDGAGGGAGRAAF